MTIFNLLAYLKIFQLIRVVFSLKTYTQLISDCNASTIESELFIPNNVTFENSIVKCKQYAQNKHICRIYCKTGYDFISNFDSLYRNNFPITSGKFHCRKIASSNRYFVRYFDGTDNSEFYGCQAHSCSQGFYLRKRSREYRFLYTLVPSYFRRIAQIEINLRSLQTRVGRNLNDTGYTFGLILSRKIEGRISIPRFTNVNTYAPKFNSYNRTVISFTSRPGNRDIFDRSQNLNKKKQKIEIIFAGVPNLNNFPKKFTVKHLFILPREFYDISCLFRNNRENNFLTNSYGTYLDFSQKSNPRIRNDNYQEIDQESEMHVNSNLKDCFKNFCNCENGKAAEDWQCLFWKSELARQEDKTNFIFGQNCVRCDRGYDLVRQRMPGNRTATCVLKEKESFTTTFLPPVPYQLTLSNPRFGDGLYWDRSPHNLPPEKAIDGTWLNHNPLTGFAHSVYSSQATSSSRTFIVDLPNYNTSVEKVIIYPRQSCCFDRYEQMTVIVGGTYCVTDQNRDGWAVETKKETGIVFECGGVVGSDIFVDNGSDHLQIAEIVAFGIE